MRIVLLSGLGALCLAAGIWMLLRHDYAAALPLLLAIPLAAWNYAVRGDKACVLRCRRRCSSRDEVIVA